MDLRLAGSVAGMNVYVSTDLDANSTLINNQAALERLIELVYRPVGAIFGVNPKSMHVFCDTKGPSIALIAADLFTSTSATTSHGTMQMSSWDTL